MSARLNDVDESVPVRYLKISRQSSFETLWALRLFQAINAKAGSLIDDYEEALIETAAVGPILQAVDEIRSRPESLSAETQAL